MTITYRPGTIDDSFSTYQVFLAAVSDLGARLGTQVITGGDDPAVIAQLWERRQPLYEHLARTGDQFWLAERDGQVIGYARSIVRDAMRELTEFFVMPGQQSAGVGRELLARAFPKGGTANRSIIATIDRRALSRYIKSGVTARFPICGMSRTPDVVAQPASGLTIAPASDSPETLGALGNIDAAVLGYRRDIDHLWLLGDRQGYLYKDGSRVVGYGYVGYRSGPFALLDASDYPAVLAHAESTAAAQGLDYFALELPMGNRTAINYLLARGFEIDAFFAFYLTDHPVGALENYIFTSPPFFA